MGRKTAGILVGAALVIAFLPVGGAAREKVERKVGAELVELDHSDISPPLRRIQPIPPQFQDNEEHEVKRLPHHHPFRTLGRQPDFALQSVPGPLVGTTAGLSFDGVGVPGYTVTGAPPDTNGAVGATQYVQWVNVAFSVFDKATGNKLYGPANGNTLWQGFGGRCETDNSGDPIVVYDKAADRWVMTQFAVSAAPYFQCIAVSTTSDATGTWRRFAYQFPDFNDYPKAGVWPDAYYISFNMFNGTTQAFLGAKACAFDRNQMITPSGTPGAMQCFQLSTTYGGLLPADLDGATPPPAGSPNYFVAFDDTSLSGLNLWKFHVDWTNPASTTFTGPVSIPTAAFTEACNGGTCITQPSTTQQLDSLADRLMYRLAYRNFGDHESLVVNHSVNVSGHSGVRWYEIRSPNAGPTVFQQGTFSPDASHRWMGSIGQDRSGNMLLGYSVSSGTVRPSIRYTGRLATDPAGSMQGETEMFTGVGSQTTTLSRWGDYSALTIDPADDCTFWYTNEYLKASGTFNWSTRIASFKFASCGGTPTPDFSVGASPSSVSVTQGSSATSTVTVTSLNGFNGAVTLSASGLPSGVSASFSPASVTPPANGSAASTLTLTASATATTGTATIAVTGTSGTSHSASINLTVNPAGGGGGAQAAVFDSVLRAPKCATVGISCDSGTSLLLGRDGKGPEPNQPNTINGSCADGTSGTFHSDESNDRIKVSTTDGSSFAAGKTVRIDATVWAWTTPSSDHLDLYYAADATSPAWTLVATLTPTAAGAQTLSASYTLPAGPLQAVRAQFRYQGAAISCSTGAYDDHDDLVFAVTPPAPDTTPPTTSITAPANGATVSGTTTVTASAADDVGVTRVEFYVDGALRATDTAAPYTFSWDTTAYAAGSHGLVTKAYDAAGNVGTSATVTVTVSNTGPVTVFYDGAESATTTLTFTSTTSDTQWFRNSTSAYAGTWRYRAGNPANPTGNYGNNGDARMTTPTLNLAGASTATLTYAFKHSTEASFDFFEVRVSTDGGTNWTTLVHVSGQSANWNLWAPLATINLNAYAGQGNVKVQFRLTTDVSVVDWGAAVDEIKVVKQ
jgi:Big-like domain-containing protein/immune inhibitor InhA-like protein